MQKIVRSLFLVVMMTCTTTAFSQSVTVTAAIDSTTMPIGQQSGFHITINGPASLHYTLPSFPGDSLIKGIEVVTRGHVDTTKESNGYIKIKANYKITSFDSGFYYIPPIKILAGKDTFESNNLSLKVLTYNVDTTKHQLFDIKGVQAPPFVWADYLLPVLLVLLIIALGLLGWWYFRKRKQKGELSEEEAMLANLPPHVVAIMELDKLKSEKLWHTGRNKEFYTRMSDILRIYINRRFQVDSLEMTTGEILELFRRDKNTQSVYQNLKQILQLADLVKFAKLTPLENDNELSMMNAYLFVNQTKKTEEVLSVEEQKEAMEEQMADNEPKETPKNDQEDYLKKYQQK
ncbi:MAG: hypothetical protein Q8914_13620 [Bacteroidota bacterium]|nr:hypothetical protein [Bacteroidota bacterium]